VEKVYKDFSKHLKIEWLGKLMKHLRKWSQWLEDKNTKEIYLKAMMPEMLKEIEEAFADATAEFPRHWATPGYPRTRLNKKAFEGDEELKVLNLSLANLCTI